MAEPAFALADVGGTNTRLAPSDGQTIGPVTRYANRDFDDFDSLFDDWLGRQNRPPARACVALAGPVSGQQARLTNRDWLIDAARLSARMDGGEVALLNDLSALAYAVTRSEFSGARAIDGTPDGPAGDQWLVLGLGTGVNAAAGRRLGDDFVVLDAEIGYTAPPATVDRALPGGTTVEALFNGAGLARLAGTCTAEEAVTAAGDAPGPLNRFAHALGLFCHDLGYHHLPRGGFYLAGSVARAVLDSPARAGFLDGWAGGPVGAGDIGTIPLRLIEDDAAALGGCLAYLARRG